MQPSNEVNILAAKEFRKLSGQDFFIADAEAMDNLVDTLIEYAEDEEHIKRMVRTWVRRTRKMLHPSDIAALAHETSNAKGYPAPCSACAGVDWIFTDKGMKRCSCPRGRKLAAAEARKPPDEMRNYFASVGNLATPTTSEPQAEPREQEEQPPSEPKPKLEINREFFDRMERKCKVTEEEVEAARQDELLRRAARGKPN